MNNKDDLPLTKIAGKIWFDGKMIEAESAVTSVLSHSLHYGSAVFEGERSYNKKIFALNQHSERLVTSAHLLGYEIPYTAEEISKISNEVISINNLTDAYVRPIAWLGVHKLGITPVNCPVHLAIAAWAWPTYFSNAAKNRGLKVKISRKFRRPPPDCAPTASKAAGLYIMGTLARKDASAGNFDDALMLDYRGLIAEGTGANIFFVKDGKLFTPTPDCFLDGITRRTIMKIAKKRNLEVIEGQIAEKDLPSFSEAFFAGTAVEVTPLASIDDHKFEIGQIGSMLMRDYKNIVSGL